MDNNTKEFLGENSNDNQNKSNNIVMTGASAILAGMDGWLNRSISNLEYIPNSLWKSLARHTFKPAGIVIDINSIMTAEGEKERFKAYYGVFLSNFGAIGGGLIGGAMGGIVGAAGGSALGNLGGNQFAEFSSDFVYDFIQRIQSIGTTNPRLTLADIKLVEALFDQYTQKDSIQSNKQDRISCLQPTISQSPNLTNKNISVSFRSAISSKTTQNPKDETLNLKNQISTKGQTMNPNFLTLLIGDSDFNALNTPNTTKQHSFILSKALINESLEFPFSIECEGYIETIKDNLLDKSQDLNPKNLINQPAIFSIKNPSKLLNNRPNKVYSGILSNVKYLGFETLENSLNHRHFFHFKVESVLIKMSLNKANRIYIDLNVPEVIKETLNFYNDTLNKEIDFSNILLDYEKQELISQYQESDLDFITRIAHNCGIFFYETSDKIYFCDHYKKGTSHLIPYNSNPNNNLKQECINAILQENQISANSFTHSSTHFSQPANISTSTTNPNPNDALSNKHFYENAPISKVYENRFKMLDEILNVKSNIYELQLCDFLEIKGFRDGESFVLVANTQILSNDINFQGCENVLTLLPNHLIFTPSPKAKPKAPNCTQGIVIGKGLEIEQERNTIYTDDYGRVKVRINLYAAQESIDEKQGIYHHTPFLRVASPIASHHSGFYHTPRVGDEVIISFLDEDIDKPYVSSSLYNGTTTMPQYNYPRYKREIASDTLSSLSAVPTMINKGLEELQLQEDTDYSLSPTNHHYLTLANATIGTDNIEARARNEITLKNDKDKEEIYILAQKDYKEEIGNNYEQTIKSNKTSEVGALYTEFITLGHMQNIVGFKNVNVGAEYLENTLLSKDTNVGLNNTLNVGVNNEVNITQNYEEKIGNDKKVIVNNNLEQVIGNDSIQRVGHNKNETIQGSYVIQSNDSIKMFSKKDTSIETNEYFKAEADDSISFKAKNDCSFTSDFINILANKESLMVAQKKIVSQVGNATIEQTKDKVIIQVGKVQVIIDDKGLRVKGGDLRAD